MKILELFCGTKSFTKVCEERGHECFTVDIDPQFKPDLCIDITDLKPEMIPFKPDIIWASPPCTEYSHAKRTGIRKIHIADSLVMKTLGLILALRPKYWFIENPQTGLLKDQYFMIGIPYKDLTYCKYGMAYRKMTRVWTNCDKWLPRPICQKDCNSMSPDGKKHIWSCGNARPEYLTGLTKHGLNKKDKYIIPRELCLEVLKSIEASK